MRKCLRIWKRRFHENKLVASRVMQTLRFWPSLFPLTKPLQEKKAQHFVVKPINHCMITSEKDWLILFLIGWPFCWTGICSASKFSVVFWIFKSLKRSSDMIWTGKEGGWLVEDDVARNVCERLKVAILLLCDSSDAPMPLWRQVWKRAQKTLHNPYHTFYKEIQRNLLKALYIVAQKGG